MSALLVQDCDAIVTSAKEPVQFGADILCENGVIKDIGPDLSVPHGADVIKGRGLFVYPGLVNTHHHFFQCFVRNRAELDWTRYSVIEWLDRIYPIFSRLTEDCFYHSSVVAMAELIKHGCTTAFDHQYCFPQHAGSRIIDRQFEAADLMGLRFHAGRGGNTLPKSQGSTIPDEMLETTDAFIAACERAIDAFHDPSPLSMRQVAVAPCQPVNCYRDTFEQSVKLARDKGVLLHTHVGEGESAVIEEVHGMRTVDYCESLGFAGSDTFYAHCWELSRVELAKLSATGTGVSHCPEPVYLVGAEVTDLPAMDALGVRVGLGCDGAASNDNSNLMHCVHSAYMLQCLAASTRQDGVPAPARFLEFATEGGASLLGRSDIGALRKGMAADLFAIDTNKLDFVGTRHDPISLIAKVGIGAPVDLTIINGRIVWKDGAFPHLDEAALFAAAEETLQTVLPDTKLRR